MWVIASRIVISRDGFDPSFSLQFANAGRYLLTLSSRFSFPSSTKIMALVAVIGLVIEAIENNDDGRIFFSASRSDSPTALR